MSLPRILSACLLSAAVAAATAADVKPKFASDVLRSGTVDIDVDISGAKALYLVVGDGGDGFAADWADWVDPVLVGPGGQTKLTDLQWRSATTGWGSAHAHKNVNGGDMRVGGKPVDGIGVHAISQIVYDISGKGFTRFKAKAGPDNGGTDQNGGTSTSIQFYVFTEPPPRTYLGGPAATPFADLPPADSVAAMTVADGLQVTLWASEPMFCNPTDIDVDSKGRVWVDEGLNYRRWEHNRPAGDRIVVMEDSTGSGKADKCRVFYQNNDVNAALGMCVLGNKILVSDSPNVFVFTDNGDGQPPTKELMFTGIDGHQHDHGMHTFVFGPDGKLYFNFGNEGHQIRDKDGKPIIDVEGNEVNNQGKPYRMGMAFRCNPDGSEFEVLGWNFRNNYEVNVDSFGNVWQSDNDDDGNRSTRINFVMEHGNYGYTQELTGAGWPEDPGMLAFLPPGKDNQHIDTVARHWHKYDPGTVPNLLDTGAGSPTGILAYEGDLLPEKFRGQLIHCEPGSNVVRSYILSPEGAGYHADIVNILSSHDSWFRPSDVCVAPDGALMVADWFDPGVGGHQMGDNNPETAGGRIYRVSPAGNHAVVPKLDLTTAAGAAHALCSPNLATRYLAWTKLHDLGAAAEPELLKLWNDSNPRMRARALWLLTKIPERGAHYVSAALKDADSDIRITGLRAARQIKLDVIPLVRRLLHDPSAQVRRECLIALRHNPSAEMPAMWADLATMHDGSDRWYIEALGIGADKRENDCFKAWLDKVGDQWDTPAGREVIWRSRANGVSELLAKIILKPTTTPFERQHYFRAFAFQPAEERDAAMLLLLSATGPGADEMRGQAAARVGNLDSPQARSTLASVLEKAKGTSLYVTLVEHFKMKDHDPELLAYALAHKSESSGAQALRLVLENTGFDAVEKATAGEDAVAAITVLGNVGDPRALALFKGILADTKRTVEVRQEAVRGLSKLEDGAHWLLDQRSSKAIPAELASVTDSALDNSPWPEVRAAIAKAHPVPVTVDGTLPPFAELVRKPGDSAHGKQVFSTVCITCHQVNGLGVDFGPNLSEIGTKLGKDALYEAVIYPNAGIEFGYETTKLTLKNGATKLGIVVSDTADELALKEPGGAIVGHYKKSDIVTRTKEAFSLMPTGLQNTMHQQDVVDLIEYLSTLKKK